MFNRKSIYALNKKDPNAIVYGANGSGLQTARSRFRSSDFWATTWGRTTTSW